MSLKNTKTILFASIIALMIIPASMSNNAEATEEFPRQAILKAFENTADYVDLNSYNLIKLNIFDMIAGGVDSEDIMMMVQYEKLNNDVMKQYIFEKNSGEPSPYFENVKDNLLNGKFSHLFHTTAEDRDLKLLHVLEPACGITSGDTSTYPPTPTIYIGLNGIHEESEIRALLVNMGLHNVWWPASDAGDIVYADWFTQRTIDSCNNGEFRNEHHVYSGSESHNYGTDTSDQYHTLVQLNEPNPELLSYTHPATWWTGFVIDWHQRH